MNYMFSMNNHTGKSDPSLFKNMPPTLVHVSTEGMRACSHGPSRNLPFMILLYLRSLLSVSKKDNTRHAQPPYLEQLEPKCSNRKFSI